MKYLTAYTDPKIRPIVREIAKCPEWTFLVWNFNSPHSIDVAIKKYDKEQFLGRTTCTFEELLCHLRPDIEAMKLLFVDEGRPDPATAKEPYRSLGMLAASHACRWSRLSQLLKKKIQIEHRSGSEFESRPMAIFFPDGTFKRIGRGWSGRFSRRRMIVLKTSRL